MRSGRVQLGSRAQQRKSPSYFAHRRIRLRCFREWEVPESLSEYSAMNWITWMFLAALAAETATRLWLASRQIDAVITHRNRVPEAFQGQIALADQQKAADYTLARVRLGRWATVVEALIKVGFTLGGGLAAMDAWMRHSALTEPWRGCLLIL